MKGGRKGRRVEGRDEGWKGQRGKEQKGRKEGTGRGKEWTERGKEGTERGKGEPLLV